MHPEHPEQRTGANSQTAAVDSLSGLKAFGGVDDEEFLRLIEPLEAAADRVLDGAAREKARRAWRDQRRGFEVVARRALRQGTRNPVGLMLWMLDRRHHEAAERALDRAETDEPKQQGECFVCSLVGEVFPYAGQWFCATHRDEQQAFDGSVAL
jgi:hypothetical protein